MTTDGLRKHFLFCLCIIVGSREGRLHPVHSKLWQTRRNFQGNKKYILIILRESYLWSVGPMINLGFWTSVDNGSRGLVHSAVGEVSGAH